MQGEVAEWLRSSLQNCTTRVRIPSSPPSPGGGIGRRAGLKILFSQESAGSIPASGTRSGYGIMLANYEAVKKEPRLWRGSFYSFCPSY